MLKKTGNIMRFKYLIMATILGLLLTSSNGYCLEITASVDKTKISLEDSVYLNLEVRGGKAKIDISVIKDFKTISRGSSSYTNIINGKVERKLTYKYVLIPLRAGKLIIPSIRAEKGKKTAISDPIVINVLDQVVNHDDVSAIFAKASLSKPSMFEGQGIVYSILFYTSKRLAGLGFENPPDFNGFTAKQFEKEKQYYQNINGVKYQVTQVDFYLTPELSGNFTIQPVSMIANVIVNTGSDPFFDSIFSSNRTKPQRVVTNPVTLDVLKLPLYLGDEKATGLIGKFNIEAQIDQQQLKVGDSATLTIKISGSGNIMDASLPDFVIDSNVFKVYDDNPIESIQLTQNGYEGYKLYKKAIVPIRAGKFDIPPIKIIYFDVDEKKYKHISTQVYSLDVTPSGELVQAVSPTSNQGEVRIDKQEVTFENTDILEIKEGLEVLKNHKNLSPAYFFCFTLLPGVMFVGVFLFSKAKGREIPIEKQMELKSKKHFKKAQKMGVNENGFLYHLYTSIAASIMAKADKKSESLTIHEARTILHDAGIDQGKTDETMDLLETIESIRFGGRRIDENAAKHLLSKTKDVLKTFSIVLLCYGFFILPSGSVNAAEATQYFNGINSYKAGDYLKAAQEFESLINEDFKNPYLFYNIGNAYLRAKNIGGAILWYERAKKLIPNDPDLKFNLEYANTLTMDKKETQMNLMDILFFWDRILSAKTIQILAIILSCLFFAWASIRTLKRQSVISGAGLVLSSLFVLITIIVCVNFYKERTQNFAIIIPNEVAVHSGITRTSTKLFTLHTGTKVSVKEVRDGYLKIHFSKDKIGWIKSENASII